MQCDICITILDANLLNYVLNYWKLSEVGVATNIDWSRYKKN